MGKKYIIVFYFLICLCLTGCEKKEKSIEEQIKGTIYSEMNFAVDKEKREVYETEHYAVQLTDSQWSEGQFYCVLAAWCKDGSKKRIAQGSDASIGGEFDVEKIEYGCDPLMASSAEIYYAEGITYICYSGVYTQIRGYLNFELYLIPKEGERTKIASWNVAPKEITDELENVLFQKDSYTVYEQSDESLLIYDGELRCHITKLGIYLRDTEEFEEKEAVLIDKDGKKIEIPFKFYSQPNREDFRGIWAAGQYILLEELQQLEIDDQIFVLRQ